MFTKSTTVLKIFVTKSNYSVRLNLSISIRLSTQVIFQVYNNQFCLHALLRLVNWLFRVTG